MSEINSSNFKKEHGDLAPDLVGVTEMPSPYFFVPPSGTTAERPSDCEPGTLRFNIDHGSLEIFRGKTIGWEQIQRRDSQYLGGGTGSNAGTGTRAVNFGGSLQASPGPTVNTIDFLTVEILGNAEDFGDLQHNETSMAAISDNTRILCVGGTSNHPSAINTIEFMTIASTGNSSDFGDALTACVGNPYGAGNRTRGVYGGGGHPANTNTLEFITIQSAGNGVNFGDLSATAGAYRRGNAGSTTRGIIMGNYAPGGDSHANHNTIEFITFATTGNGADFGDLTQTSSDSTSSSNCVRAVRYGKWPTNGTIDFVTIATLGDAIDFGDMLDDAYHAGSCTNPTRMLHVGGSNKTYYNSIEFITIMTTGNGQDFGDLTYSPRGNGTNTNGHGGL